MITFSHPFKKGGTYSGPAKSTDSAQTTQDGPENSAHLPQGKTCSCKNMTVGKYEGHGLQFNYCPKCGRKLSPFKLLYGSQTIKRKKKPSELFF